MKAYTIIIILTLSITSCKKYLEAKPDKSLEVPTTVNALQGILNYSAFMNELSTLSGEIASDNYYLSDSLYYSLPADRMRKAYTWKDNIFAGDHPDDWQNEYTIVYNANVVLEYLTTINKTKKNEEEWDNCKGQALTFRAKSFFEIAQVWAKTYNSSTASKELGIPLRLNPDYNTPTTRATIKKTYEQIITDLKKAIPLLPNTGKHVLQPSKSAAYALLARTYLVMGEYRKANLYSDSCLDIQNTLLDFNILNQSSKYPFSEIQYTNPEDILHTTAKASNYNLKESFARIDTALYKSFDKNDLRKTIFFKSNKDGSHYFSGNYHGTTSSVSYNGIAVDELYLIKAECLARLGDGLRAMKTINKLLQNRWKQGTFKPVKITNAEQALKFILKERRKELIYRALRFSDIKRLNRDGANISLIRIIGGKKYKLEPNDNRFALPIPANVIKASGIKQN